MPPDNELGWEELVQEPVGRLMLQHQVSAYIMALHTGPLGEMICVNHSVVPASDTPKPKP